MFLRDSTTISALQETLTTMLMPLWDRSVLERMLESEDNLENIIWVSSHCFDVFHVALLGWTHEVSLLRV